MARHRAPARLGSFLTPEFRSGLYRVALAVLALLAGYKFLGPDEVPLWADLIESILGVGAAGTAVAFRPGGKRLEAERSS